MRELCASIFSQKSERPADEDLGGETEPERDRQQQAETREHLCGLGRGVVACRLKPRVEGANRLEFGIVPGLERRLTHRSDSESSSPDIIECAGINVRERITRRGVKDQ
jgi:hypothetical protein